MSSTQPQTAYPIPAMGVDENGRPVMRVAEWGLTKRELIAAMCLQGLNACRQGDESSRILAKVAVEDADALLSELAKAPEVKP